MYWSTKMTIEDSIYCKTHDLRSLGKLSRSLVEGMIFLLLKGYPGQASKLQRETLSQKKVKKKEKKERTSILITQLLTANNI